MMQKFDTKSALEHALATKIALVIQKAIDTFGDARILLSGGSTPIDLYDKLSTIPLEWEKVTIGLVDERFVPTIDEASNELMIHKQLAKNEATNVTILGMVTNTENRTENCQQANKTYQLFAERTDFTLLGMGEDGHTASLFPNDPASEKLLTSDEIGIFNTQAPVFPFNRITCSAALLLKSKHLALMLIGEKKRTIFEQAATTNLPISYFNDSLSIYYTN